MNLGAPELLIVLVIILLVFGGAKLPQLARSLGLAKKEFEDGVRDGEKSDGVQSDGDATPSTDA